MCKYYVRESTLMFIYKTKRINEIKFIQKPNNELFFFLNDPQHIVQCVQQNGLSYFQCVILQLNNRFHGNKKQKIK